MFVPIDFDDVACAAAGSHVIVAAHLQRRWRRQVTARDLLCKLDRAEVGRS
jgi:hypothetical protein